MPNTDGSGGVAAAYQYDAFGAVKTKTGTADTNWRFTGEMNDSQVARGLYYLRARYYDPSLGRFLSRDPLAGVTRMPQSLNRYPYVLNNPILLVDPLGLTASEGGPLCSRFPTAAPVPTPPPVTPTPRQQHRDDDGLWGMITGGLERVASAARSTLAQQACSGTFGSLTPVTCPLFSPTFEPARTWYWNGVNRASDWLMNTCAGDVTRALAGGGLIGVGVVGAVGFEQWELLPLVGLGAAVGFGGPSGSFLGNCY